MSPMGKQRSKELEASLPQGSLPHSPSHLQEPFIPSHSVTQNSNPASRRSIPCCFQPRNHPTKGLLPTNLCPASSFSGRDHHPCPEKCIFGDRRLVLHHESYLPRDRSFRKPRGCPSSSARQRSHSQNTLRRSGFREQEPWDRICTERPLPLLPEITKPCESIIHSYSPLTEKLWRHKRVSVSKTLR